MKHEAGCWMRAKSYGTGSEILVWMGNGGVVKVNSTGEWIQLTLSSGEKIQVEGTMETVLNAIEEMHSS